MKDFDCELIFLGIKYIQRIKLLYINQKQDPHLGLTTFYIYVHMHMAATREPPLFPPIIGNILGEGMGIFQAAIETTHKAWTSEQLNDPPTVAVGLILEP